MRVLLCACTCIFTEFCLFIFTEYGIHAVGSAEVKRQVCGQLCTAILSRFCNSPAESGSTQKMATKVWGQKSKIDEELDYFTELALHESERWIQVCSIGIAIAK